jgi:hypothetical protein
MYNGSEEEQRFLDSTCRKLPASSINTSAEPQITHESLERAIISSWGDGRPNGLSV